jgi:hypothetical protein
MSPLTALFLGIFGVGAVGIASGTAVVLYGMRIVDTRATELLGFADGTINTTLDQLPELIESLPDAIGDLLSDRRSPEYATELDLDVGFVVEERSKSLRPVMTITNRGDQVVSLLAVRVAALNEGGLPIREWTEMAATPVAIEDWRGPLLPGKTRYLVMGSGWRGLSATKADQITGAVEIADIRVWKPDDAS